MIVSIVAAASENNVIGQDNDLPWHLPDDFKHFKKLTEGHSVVMGRKTFDSLGKPLPNRRNLVLTQQDDWNAEGVEVMHSLGDALKACMGEEEVFIIGGGAIYHKAMDLNMVDKIYLTRVHADVQGDTRFPEVEKDQWVMESMVRHDADDKHSYAFSIVTYVRKRKR